MPQAAHAAPAGPCAENTRANGGSRSATIHRAITCLVRSGLTLNQVDQAMEKNYHVQARTHHLNGDLQPFTNTNNGDVNPEPPTFYYDSGEYGGIRGWYVWSFWSWSGSNAWYGLDRESDACWFSNPCALGGYDGYGISFSRPVQSVRSYEMQTWGVTDYYPPSYDRAHVSDGNTAGATFTGQDEYKQGLAGENDYSFANGIIYYDVSSIGCGTIQAFTKYAHTWDDTGINGIGVGPWSLSVQWANSGANWERASQPSSPVTPC
jgi:hypothetical protein